MYNKREYNIGKQSPHFRVTQQKYDFTHFILCSLIFSRTAIPPIVQYEDVGLGQLCVDSPEEVLLLRTIIKMLVFVFKVVEKIL